MVAEMTSFALRIAERARRETLGRWASGCAAEDKGGAADFDPVTEADREAELAMRALIEQEYPSHGIAGEEFPARLASGPYRWSLDPIDGTRSFTCGLPTWVTLIALLEHEVPVLGVIDVPRLDETYVGEGADAWLQAGGVVSPLRASTCRELSQARLSTTDPNLFPAAAAKAFEQVRTRARTVRFGHDGYGYARLAAGSLDLVIECGLKEHDYLALIPVVRGAGGVIGDWRGGEDFAPGQVIAAATPDLYAAAVAIMGPAA